MDWVNDKIEFSKRDVKHFDFYPGQTCVIQTVKIWKGSEVSLFSKTHDD